MASCSQTLNGIAAVCGEGSVGGVIIAYIANASDVKSVTIDPDTQEISTITMEGDAKFKAYHFRKGSSSLTSTMTRDDATGVLYFQNDLALVFAKQETRKRIEVAALALGELAVITKDANGKYHYLGYNEPVTSTAAGAATGTARGDANNYTVTLTDISESLPYMAKDTAVAAVVED